MLLAVIKTEWIKLRRAPVWIAFVVLPVLAAVMGTFNYVQNAEILHEEWYSLWTQHTLFCSFFFQPALIGVLCAYQWRLEHRENNWNALMTHPVPVWTVFCGKLAVSAVFVLLSQLATGALFLLCGKLARLSGTLPPELPRWLLLGALAGIAVAATQLYLSMRIRGFAIPVGLALCGGIIGLAIANAGYGLFFPYALLAIGMDANGRELLQAGELVPYVAMCAVYIFIPSALAAYRLKRRDIETK